MNYFFGRYSVGYFFLLATIFLNFSTLYAQTERDEGALISTEKGFSVREDDAFLLNIRFRMQNRIGLRSRSIQDWTVDEIEARVRRLRLRFDGFVGNQALRYYIQLSFSRSDLDFDNSGESRLVRDAMVYYHFNPHFYIGLGQSKLPGNRQRVTSSGNLQLADRSIANNQFTMDRDFGLFAYYNLPLGVGVYSLKSVLSTGEGRNVNRTDGGLAYTLRSEWLPMGAFADGGDYSEGDLAFERQPKLSLAATYGYNAKTTNTGGQIGLPLAEAVNLRSWVADAVFKYRGHACLAEFFYRSANKAQAITPAADLVNIPVGTAWNTQYSYTWHSIWEGVFRYSRVNRTDFAAFRQQEELRLGVNRYINGHRIKLQTHVGYQRAFDQQANRAWWVGMLQVEFGI